MENTYSNPEGLHPDTIQRKIDHLEKSVTESIIKTGVDTFCVNRIKRIEVLKSYLDIAAYEQLARENEQLSSLFNRLWTKAVGSVSYDKDQWKQLQKLLLKRGIIT